ncbi:MAG: GNAT family N-acetyltransferase [Stenotrophobium sp.]
MRIRHATLADVEALAAISTEFGYKPGTADLAERLQQLMALPDHAVFAAEDEGVVLGWGHARITRQIETPSYAELAALVVTQGRRSQGIGSTLVAAAEQWARGQGQASIRVRSNVIRERAHRFYLREGYAELKQQKTFVKTL